MSHSDASTVSANTLKLVAPPAAEPSLFVAPFGLFLHVAITPLRFPGLTPLDALVIARFRRHWHHQLRVIVEQAALAQYVGCSVRAVTASVARLVTAGLITTQRRWAAPTTARASEYTPTPDLLQAFAAEAARVAAGRRAKDGTYARVGRLLLPDYILSDPRLSPTDKLVAAHILRLLSTDHALTIGAGRIAELAELPRKAAQRSIASLVATGVIARVADCGQLGTAYAVLWSTAAAGAIRTDATPTPLTLDELIVMCDGPDGTLRHYIAMCIDAQAAE